MKSVYVLILLALPMMAGTAACAEPAKPVVFVSILPQKYFVQQIGMDRVEVEVMVQPGASPATYEPKASQMRKLAGASGYFSIGVPFEKAWLDRIARVNPDMKIIHTDAGIEKIAMASHLHEEDAHGDEHHPEENGLDPHIWLSPSLVRLQVQTIYDGLVQLFPDSEDFFQQNLAIFLDRLTVFEEKLTLIMQPHRGAEFMVFHPSWGYFAREYGLKQIAVEVEGKSPKPAQLGGLIEHATQNGIRVVFAQPQFSSKSARVIARAIGGRVTMIDPLAENWPENLQRVAMTFREVLGPGLKP